MKILKKLFDAFRETQMNFQQNKCKVKKLAKKIYKKAQEQAQQIEKDSNISELMNAEQNEPSIPRNQPNYR